MSTVFKPEKIEEKIDKTAIGTIAIGNGGVQFSNMIDIMEFSKMMSISGQAIPPHLRNNPGICLAVVLQAIEWRMSPIAVANKSYVVSDRICYESQLIHAVIEQRAPTIGRLRHEFIGTGDKRQCRVWATDKNETEPFSYTSPVISSIKPKNSPLWTTKPDLQLFYNTSRDWARIYYPDVIMGVYSDDEMDVVSIRPSGPVQLSKLNEPEAELPLDNQEPSPVEQVPNSLKCRDHNNKVLADFKALLPTLTTVESVKDASKAACKECLGSQEQIFETNDLIVEFADSRIAELGG